MNDIGPCPECGETKQICWSVHSDELVYSESLVCKKCGFRVTDTVSDEVKWRWNTHNDKKALRPCPFCGGKVELRYEIRGGDETFSIHCNECHIHFTKFEWVARDASAVTKEWNTRVKR